jgi:hypothetical protein
VVEWLVANRIDRGRLRSAGIGMDRPIASNDDEVGRQKNRRVEFHITQDESLKKPEEQGGGEPSGGTGDDSDESTDDDANDDDLDL